MERCKARSFALIILVAAVTYNVPRFFEYDPTYSVAYVCPNTTLSSRWSQGTRIEDTSYLVDEASSLSSGVIIKLILGTEPNIKKIYRSLILPPNSFYLTEPYV
jgi:hypothetical protein